jgi:hypothetical protein
MNLQIQSEQIFLLRLATSNSLGELNVSPKDFKKQNSSLDHLTRGVSFEFSTILKSKSLNSRKLQHHPILIILLSKRKTE